MIKTVNWNGVDLHTIEWEVDNELQWCFFGSEVCNALEYSKKYTDVINGDKKTKEKVDCKNKYKVKKKELEVNFTDSVKLDFIGRNGDILITELGTYALIFGSDMPLATEFKEWVFGLLKQLRENAGLEQYEAFRMMDKKVQVNIQKVVAKIGDLDNDATNCIVMNKNVNKLISCELFKFNKPLTKPEMEKHVKMMLIDRQEVLTKYADYLLIADGSHSKAYEMTSKWIKFKYSYLLDEAI